MQKIQMQAGFGVQYLFHDGGPYHIETSPLICTAEGIANAHSDNFCFLYSEMA